MPGARRTLELNPEHKLVQALKGLDKEDKESIASYDEVL